MPGPQSYTPEVGRQVVMANNNYNNLLLYRNTFTDNHKRWAIKNNIYKSDLRPICPYTYLISYNSLNNKEGGSCELNSHEEVDNASNRTQLNTSITRPYSDTIVYRDLPELALVHCSLSKKLVTSPILQTPEVYFQHFYALFVPR